MFLERYKDTMIVYNNIMERLRNELMKKIEKDGEQKIIQLGRSAYELARKQNGMMPGAIAEASISKNSNQPNSPEQTNHIVDSLQNIMKDGSNEFVKKMGREPTYSEMRGMYG